MTKKLAVLGMMILLVAGTSAAIDTGANQKGRLTSTGNGQTRTFYQYDRSGRAVATQIVQDGQSRTFRTKYGYPQNRDSTAGPGFVVLEETRPDGETIQYTYDLTSMQVGMRSTLGAATDAIVRHQTTNERGQLTRIELGNGVVTTFEYDETGHLQLIRSKSVNSSEQVVQDYTYEYDQHGNVTKTTDGVVPSQSVTLKYDEQDQLIELLNADNQPIEQYDYDEIGNLVRKGVLTQQYGPLRPDGVKRPHALRSSGVDTYQYDANGNVTTIGSHTAIEWNAENMSTKVTAGPKVTEKSFVGEAVWKKVEEGVTTYYLPSMRIENGVARKYYAQFAERLEQGGDRQLRFYHPDHLGSSTVMTDNAGQPIRRASYFPWGQDRAAEGFTPKLQFNFKEKDANGFYDYGARIYNPVTGRWLSPDNTLSDGLNRYAYARNNPWTRIDPTGHNSEPTAYWAICPAGVCRGLYPLYRWYDEAKEGPLPPEWSRVDMSSGHRDYYEVGTTDIFRLLPNGHQQVFNPDTEAWTDLGKQPWWSWTRQQMVDAVYRAPDPNLSNEGLYSDALVEVGRRTRGTAFTALIVVAETEMALLSGSMGGATVSFMRGALPMVNAVKPVVVLGKFKQMNNYIQVASKVGGRVFNVPMKHWEKMDKARQWVANKTFIDRAVKAGDRIYLATNPAKITGGFLKKEVEHLQSLGYRIVKEGRLWTFVK